MKLFPLEARMSVVTAPRAGLQDFSLARIDFILQFSSTANTIYICRNTQKTQTDTPAISILLDTVTKSYIEWMYM